jgi:hypothetical protein
MRSSSREGKLRALLSDHSEVRESVSELANTYEAFLAEDVRGTRLAHMVEEAQVTQELDHHVTFDETSLHESSLPHAILLLLVQFLNQKHRTILYSSSSDDSTRRMLSPRVRLLDKFSLRGVEYSTAGHRTRNSHVLFSAPMSNSSEISGNLGSGQITHVFIHSQVSAPGAQEDEQWLHHLPIYLCIQPYAPLERQLNDVDQSYRRFEFAGGFLSGREFQPHIIVDHFSIVSHVAVTPLEVRGSKVLHILPMDRVSLTL